MFSCRNKKNINTVGLKKKKHLIKSCAKTLFATMYVSKFRDGYVSAFQKLRGESVKLMTVDN